MKLTLISIFKHFFSIEMARTSKKGLKRSFYDKSISISSNRSTEIERVPI